MDNKNRQAVLTEIDTILVAIGQKDYEQFRSSLRAASILCGNIAIWSKNCADRSREDLIKLIDDTPDSAVELKLRLLQQLRKYLPNFGTLLVGAAARMFPAQQGGAPQKLKDRDKKREACNLVLAFIARGRSEAEAKKLAAKQMRVSTQTINRTWKQRTTLTEPNIEEFLLQLFKDMTTTTAETPVQIESSSKDPAPIREKQKPV
jgi:hypothetical protein